MTEEDELNKKTCLVLEELLNNQRIDGYIDQIEFYDLAVDIVKKLTMPVVVGASAEQLVCDNCMSIMPKKIKECMCCGEKI